MCVEIGAQVYFETSSPDDLASYNFYKSNECGTYPGVDIPQSPNFPYRVALYSVASKLVLLLLRKKAEQE
jgi:hypothetical protein